MSDQLSDQPQPPKPEWSFKKKKRRGWWAWHVFKKPSVFKLVHRWEGWEAIEKKLTAPPMSYYRDIVTTLFLTGCRASELGKYCAENFIDTGEHLLVRDAPLVKNRKITKRWDFYIPKDEPPAPRLIERIEKVKANGGGPLFQTEVDRITVWWICRKFCGVWPHWFRSQRAFCLSWEYGLTYEELRAWFTWLDPNTPFFYARPSPRKIAEKLRPQRPNRSPPEFSPPV